MKHRNINIKTKAIIPKKSVRSTVSYWTNRSITHAPFSLMVQMFTISLPEDKNFCHLWEKPVMLIPLFVCEWVRNRHLTQISTLDQATHILEVMEFQYKEKMTLFSLPGQYPWDACAPLSRDTRCKGPKHQWHDMAAELTHPTSYPQISGEVTSKVNHWLALILSVVNLQLVT